MTDEKTLLLDNAIKFAVDAHSGATRKAGNTPYIVHPMEALAIASTMTDDREVIAAAALHDVIEDTDFGEEDVEKLFGKRVLELVKADSEDKRRDRPQEETWKIRKQETIDFCKNQADVNKKIVIFSDKLSNLRSIYRDYAKIGDKVWDRFHQKDKKEHGWYYGAFLDACIELRETDAYREYGELIAKIFG